MTTITLPPDVEEAFAQAARQTGTTTEVAVVKSLRAKLPAQHRSLEPEIQPGATMLDFLKDYIGAAASSAAAAGQGTMSVNPGDAFTEGMVEKRRRGNL